MPSSGILSIWVTCTISLNIHQPHWPNPHMTLSILLCTEVRNSLTDETQADLLPDPKRMETLQKHSSFCLLDFPDCTLRCVIANPFQVSGRKIGVHCQCWILLQFLICLFTQKNRHTPPNNSHQGSCVWQLFFVDKFSWSPDV
jgi:hypothetical protein